MLTVDVQPLHGLGEYCRQSVGNDDVDDLLAARADPEQTKSVNNATDHAHTVVHVPASPELLPVNLSPVSSTQAALVAGNEEVEHENDLTAGNVGERVGGPVSNVLRQEHDEWLLDEHHAKQAECERQRHLHQEVTLVRVARIALHASPPYGSLGDGMGMKKAGRCSLTQDVYYITLFRHSEAGIVI